ncbi:MAG: NAD/NADP octopine/nopaline dehydrogenase family protein [Spirochaetota bacterium]
MSSSSKAVAKSIWAVIGGGNGGQSAAGHLGILGFPVRIYDIFEETIGEIRSKGGVEVGGAVQGFGPVQLATTSIDQAVDGADVIMIIAPALAHRDIARSLAPFVRPGQIVFIHPGATFGAIEFYREFTSAGAPVDDLVICEAQSLLYACRSVSPGVVSIKGVKQKLAVSALPAVKTAAAVASLAAAFPQIVPGINVLETGLTNLNAMMHPGPSLLNTSLIESSHEWKYYLDGITPTIGVFVERLDKERLALGKAVGLELHGILEMYREMYGVHAPTLSETVRKNPAYQDIQGQKKVDTRYILEDIPMGLVPMASLARKLGVPCRMMETIISLGEEVLDRDLTTTGRTLESLGLAGMSLAGLLDFVEGH